MTYVPAMAEYSAENGTAVYSVELNEDAYAYIFIDAAEKIVSGNGNVYILEKERFTMNEKQIELY